MNAERLKNLSNQVMEHLPFVGRVRRGERFAEWTRTERVFRHGEAWYFRTREAVDVGPYQTEFEAEVECELLRARLSQLEDQRHTRGVIRSFVLEALNERQVIDGQPDIALQPLLDGLSDR